MKKGNVESIKYRNIFLVYLFSIITLGIYAIYWMVSTKNEINNLGAKIPTAWLMIVPIANFYWIYKYCEGFAQKVKKDNNTLLWFILFILLGIIMPALVQSELNKNSTKKGSTKEQKGFVWFSLRIIFYLMLFLLVLSFFISFAALNFIFLILLIFAIIVSIIHLFKHKRKAFAITALIISALILLLYTIGIIAILNK